MVINIETDKTTGKIFLWLLIISIPLIHSNLLIDISLLPKYIAFAGLLLVFSVYWMLKSRNFVISFNNFHIVLLIFFFYCGIAIFYSPLKADALFEWSKMFLLITCFTLVQTFINIKTIIDESSKAFSLLGLIISIWGIIQFYKLFQGGVTHSELYDIKTCFSHKNIFAEIMFLTIPFSLYNIVKNKAIWKITGVVSFLFCFSSIILLMTRAVWMATFISFILTLVVILIYFKPKLIGLIKLGLIAAGIILLIGFVIVIYARFDTVETFRKQTQKIFFPYGSAQERIELWNKSYQLIKEKPVFGHGLSSWKINILKEGDEKLQSSGQIVYCQRPHNDYIWILSETGITGLLLYLLVIVYFYIFLFKKIKEEKGHDRIKYPFIFMAYTGYLIFSFFSFPKERIDHLIFISIVFSIISTSKPKLQYKCNRLILLPLSFVLLLYIAFAAYRIKGEIHLKNIYSAVNNYDWSLVLVEKEKIPDKIYPVDYNSTPVEAFSGLAYYNLKKYNKAIEEYTKAYHKNPYHISILNNYGECFLYEKEYKQALAVFNSALIMAPNYETALINKCAALVFLKKHLEAFETFQKIRPSDDPRYKYYGSLIVPVKFKEIKQEISFDLIDNTLLKMENTPEWMWQLYEKSCLNQISFKKQVMIDIVYVLYDLEHIIDKEEAEKLKKKFEI